LLYREQSVRELFRRTNMLNSRVLEVHMGMCSSKLDADLRLVQVYEFDGMRLTGW